MNIDVLVVADCANTRVDVVGARSFADLRPLRMTAGSKGNRDYGG